MPAPLRLAAVLALLGAPAVTPLAAQGAAAPAPAPAAHDPMDALVREALANNLGLAGERRAAARDGAAAREAAGRFLPTLALDARYSEQSGAIDLGDLVNPAYGALNQLTGTNRFPTDVNATLPLRQETKLRLVQPLWQPALRPALDAARHAHDARDAGADGAARRVAALAQLAWLDVARAARTVELYDATLALVREQQRVAGRLVANGAATPEVVSRAAADVAEVEQAHAEAVRQRDHAARAFNDVLGRPIGAPVAPPDAASDAARDAPPFDVALDEALASARQRREELHQADAGVEAAHAQRRLARSAALPSVALALDYGIQGGAYRFGRDADVAVASLVVSWELFAGGRTDARAQQAALEADRAALARDDAGRRVELEVRAAHDAARVAHAAIATADARLRAAERTHALVSRRWAEGLAPQLELVEARTALTSAALNAILTRHAYAARRVELERAAALRAIPR